MAPVVKAAIAPSRAFWKGKRVFVTGHTGFKGSWLALRLSDLGADVFGYALPPETTPNAFELLHLDADVATTFGDVRDGEKLHAALARARPHVVMHLAAQALVRRAHREPHATFSTNVMGTVELLEAVRAAGGVELVLVVTSDKTYANREARAQREEDPLGGAEPYAASKACAEIVAGAYRETYFSGGPRLATARAGNVIGGGDWSEDRLVPDLVRASTKREPVRLRYPDAVRPWQFVADAVDGYLRIVEALDSDPSIACAWNLGPSSNERMTVEDLARAFLAIYDPQTAILTERGDRIAESPYLALDATRAGQRLGWHPRFDTDAAVAASARWYASWRAREDLRRVTLEQLRFTTEPAVAGR